ncbi:MAG: GNAT family N-acetyltransferase [Phyllobacteriaceae bacterium]|nr:GNAT family N-acetyltransferase [Phyllobacteriaceae bacterium]
MSIDKPMLRPVRREDVRKLTAMEIAPDQISFVAPNAITLAQAPYETGAFVFAIWHGDQMVGLLAMVDNREYQYAGPGDEPNSAFMWRLMIDRNHQGKGHGRAALVEMTNWVRSRGLNQVFTSVVPGNAVATRFYQSFGFALTGRLLEDEAEMRLDLTD